jgi:uncharacterized integral membrane protein
MIDLHRLKQIAVLALIGLLIVFALQNASTVEFNFLLWSMSMPRVLLYFLIFVVGCLAGWVWARFPRRR